MFICITIFSESHCAKIVPKVNIPKEIYCLTSNKGNCKYVWLYVLLTLCRVYSLCECLYNFVAELNICLFVHTEARSRIRTCNDNTLACSNTVCFSCCVRFVHAFIQCITGLFNRNHCLVSAHSFFFCVGIALHARSINKLQRNLTCGACRGF